MGNLSTQVNARYLYLVLVATVCEHALADSPCSAADWPALLACLAAMLYRGCSQTKHPYTLPPHTHTHTHMAPSLNLDFNILISPQSVGVGFCCSCLTQSNSAVLFSLFCFILHLAKRGTATTLQPLSSEVNNSNNDNSITLQCSVGKLWISCTITP